MVLADTEVNRVFGVFGLTPMITSANDSKHRVDSLHYRGRALDYRIFDVPADVLPTIHRILRWNLSPEFDVILEDDHLHIEYDSPEADHGSSMDTA